jgi:hypothetical protein
VSDCVDRYPVLRTRSGFIVARAAMRCGGYGIGRIDRRSSSGAMRQVSPRRIVTSTPEPDRAVTPRHRQVSPA